MYVTDPAIATRSRQDLFAGFLFMAVGAAFAWGATAYDIGSASDMGPGYFPRFLGVLTTLVGGIITFRAAVTRTVEDGRIGPWAWKQLVLIICANLIFGVMIGGLPSIALPPMGLVLGVYSLVFIASLAGDEFRLREVFVLATVLAIAVYGICVKVLNLYVPLWPSITLPGVS